MIDVDHPRRGQNAKERPSIAVRLAVNVPVTALLVALGLFELGVIQSLRVSSINMAPTLELEDRVMVRAYGREPVRGDVIVYRSPFDLDHLQVGRIVGVPGERVELGESGLLIDGRAVAMPLPTSPASDRAASCGDCDAAASCGAGSSDADCGLAGCGSECLVGREAVGDHRFFTRRAMGLPGLLFQPVTVPEEHYFVLSDNRIDERDSRIYGPIPNDAVVGVLSFVYYASDETGIRWDRISRPVS